MPIEDRLKIRHWGNLWNLRKKAQLLFLPTKNNFKSA